MNQFPNSMVDRQIPRYGRTFEWLFDPTGREFERGNLQKFSSPGCCPGGMLKLRIEPLSHGNWVLLK